jgi:hypothetical protein
MTYFMETEKDGKLEQIEFQLAAYVEASGKYHKEEFNTVTIYYLR